MWLDTAITRRHAPAGTNLSKHWKSNQTLQSVMPFTFQSYLFRSLRTISIWQLYYIAVPHLTTWENGNVFFSILVKILHTFMVIFFELIFINIKVCEWGFGIRFFPLEKEVLSVCILNSNLCWVKFQILIHYNLFGLNLVTLKFKTFHVLFIFGFPLCVLYFCSLSIKAIISSYHLLWFVSNSLFISITN